MLRLNVGSLDLTRRRSHRGPSGPEGRIGWGAASSELLRWLTAGRPEGPVFLTTRRAPAGRGWTLSPAPPGPHLMTSRPAPPGHQLWNGQFLPDHGPVTTTIMKVPQGAQVEKISVR